MGALVAAVDAASLALTTGLRAAPTSALGLLVVGLGVVGVYAVLASARQIR